MAEVAMTADIADAAAARELAKLAALFDSPAMALPYGEELSIRDHMLQCAEQAVAGGHDDVMVTAALLHDIGWALDQPDAEHQHQTIGADFLAPLFGRETADLVRYHVAAKRYLVASEPDYAARLSAESRRTLARQGGPMPPAERAAFAAQPCFAAAVQLRYLDDSGKAVQPPVTRFATYAPLLRRQLVKHLSSA